MKKKYILLVNHWLFAAYLSMSFLFLIGFICSLFFIVFPYSSELSLLIISLILFSILGLNVFVLIKFLLKFIILENNQIIQKSIFKDSITFNADDIKSIKVKYFDREGKFILIFVSNTYIKLAYSNRRKNILESYFSIRFEE